MLSTLLASVAFAEPLPSRIVLGGKAVVLAADAVYLFPEARRHIVAVAKADQGLGAFLAALDPAFGAKAQIDRAAGAEAYAALGSDLVIMKSSNRKSVGPGLDAIGIPQLYLDLETPEDYFRELGLLGKVFGDEARAIELITYYRESYERVLSAVETLPTAERPKVLVLQAQSAAGGSFEVPPASWMQTLMVERAGGIAVWKDANPGSGWAKVGPEQIAAWNPDIILVISYNEKASAVAASLRSDPRFSGLFAAKSARIFGFPQDFYSWDQPDVRWILGFQWAAARIHPARFAGLDMRKEAQRFYAFCYGLDAAAFSTLVAPRFSGDF